MQQQNTEYFAGLARQREPSVRPSCRTSPICSRSFWRLALLNIVLLYEGVKDSLQDNFLLKERAVKIVRNASLLTAVIIAMVFCPMANLFAYDGTVIGGFDENMTRAEFISSASDIARARNILLTALDRPRIEDFHQISSDDVDEEDMIMIGDLEEFIATEYRVRHNDGFSYLVQRGETRIGFDGWMIFSHYHRTQGWLHYLYYFQVRE